MAKTSQLLRLQRVIHCGKKFPLLEKAIWFILAAQQTKLLSFVCDKKV